MASWGFRSKVNYKKLEHLYDNNFILFHNLFFSEKLDELKLRLVDKSEWKLESNVNEKGFTKCIELDGYRNVYIDPSGKLYDLRPQDTKPSYNNFLKKSDRELYNLLIVALEKQLNELESGEKYSSEDTDVISSIRDELKDAQSNFNRLK